MKRDVAEMVDDLKLILLEVVRERGLTNTQLVKLSGLSIRTIQRALSMDGENQSVSIHVYEELFHILGIRIQRSRK